MRWFRTFLAVPLVLLLSGASRPASPSGWQYLVELSALTSAQATVTLRFTDRAPQKICADMPGAGRFVRDMMQVFPDGKSQPMSGDGDCWRLVDRKTASAQLHYRYDLAAAAEAFGSADYVQRHDEAITFSDEAVLLRPDPLPLPDSPSATAVPIEVEFRLPADLQLTTPWQTGPGPGLRFRLDAWQYDGGSYITFGAVRKLGILPLAHSQVDLFLAGKSKATDDTLRRWIEQASGSIERLYGEQMPSPIHVVLVPWSGSADLGSFGTVLRPLRPSVVIYFGGDARQFPLHDDWVATHEIFHVGNPLLRHKLPWFVEGFTTYYQDVLRARTGAMTAQETWSDLWDGLNRHCQPSGTSLQSESENLRKTHRYTRVYWGGACLALLFDVEIRKRSQGQRSLDDVMRELRKQSLRKRLDEDAVIAALGQATAPSLVQRYLKETSSLPLRETLTALGVEPTGPDCVRLRDDAQLAALRRNMF